MTNQDKSSTRQEQLSPAKQALLAKLKARKTAVSPAPQSQIPPRPADAPAALSFAQQRLWFLDQLQQPERPIYNIIGAWRLHGPLSQTALQHSLNKIMCRHEGLRTTFISENGAARQVINHEQTLPLSITDLSHLPPAEREEKMRQTAVSEAQTPFDLAVGPLIRARLLRLADDDHLLLVIMHHIVSDGWSVSLFLREMAAHYRAYVDQKPSELPPLPIQYPDFAHWQRQWLQGDELDRQLTYWREQLNGRLPILTLPTDNPRPAEPTFRGLRRRFRLSAELTAALKALSQAENSTLFMTLLAAFNVLLSRHSGQDDILVGSPIANRNRVEIEPLIGFFVNTLVLRTDLSGEPSFRQLLQRVRETTVGAMAHQDVPFEKLVEVLQPARSLSHNPLFQVVFALQNNPITAGNMPGIDSEWVPIDSGVAMFDLTLRMTDRANGLTGVLEFSTDLFTAVTIDRLLDQWQTLLAGIVANPDTAVTRLPLLPADQRRQLLRDWNQTIAYPVSGPIHEQFEAQAERRPQATAVTFKNQSLTYAQLNGRANQLAHHLRSLGVNAESRVGMFMDRSLDTVIAILGILKAGGAYVPMDPAYPAERLAFMLADAGIDVLLTESALANRLPGGDLTAAPIQIDTDWPAIAQSPDHNPNSGATAENLAYVIYTSGSTGKPKGVLVTHANVMRLFTATDNWYHFDENDVWTLFHSYAFDFSVWEIWGALLYGGRLVVVPYLTSRSPADFYRLLADEGVTVLNQTPSAFRQLIRAEDEVGPRNDLVLRFIIFGGEALELNSLRPWFDRHGDKRPLLVNMYGITETTVHVTYRPIRLADLDNAPGSVIGRPIPDLELYLLDQHQQPVPIGVTGELYVGGAGVARGYLNRPTLTARRFNDHPFNDDPDATLYRSGDLGRWLSDGDIEYLGRIDHQVKIRGFRIELGEIEAALAAHPAIREVCVLAREDEPGQKRLAAYLVAAPNVAIPTVENLRADLQETLPTYMVPAAFVFLDAFPLTTNGKIDRPALPAPDAKRADLAATYVAPRNDTEAALADVWAAVLGLERVGVKDNFFDLGGDSILSIRLLAKAREAGLEVALPDLFRYQTVAALTPHVTVVHLNQGNIRPFHLIPAEIRDQLPAGVVDAYPLSRLQAGMLFHSELEPDTALYHNVTSMKIEAPFNADLLKAALHSLVKRHPMLRTSFSLGKFEQPIQMVHEQTTIPLTVTDLRGLSAAEQTARLDQIITTERDTPFDWRQTPLLRFHVCPLDENLMQFIMTEHHVIVDGWSVANMLTELFRTYMAAVHGESTALPPVPLTYADFIAAEQRTLADTDHRAFWQNQLAGSTRLELPKWPVVQNESPAWYTKRERVQLPAELSQRLQATAVAHHMPLKSLLLAGHLRVLNHLSGQDDLMTGLVTNGRLEENGGEAVLGLFLNTVPFRLKMAGGSWIELAREVFIAEQEMLPHRRYPLSAIQQAHDGQPLFDTAFNYVHFHVYNALDDLDDLEILGETFYGQTNIDFTAIFVNDSTTGRIKIILEYDGRLFSDTQIEAMAGVYERAFSHFSQQPATAYGETSLLAPAEKRQFAVWNQTDQPYPSDCTHDLIAAQAQRTPNKTAVVFNDTQLTYRQLDDRANQLAHYLQQNGVKSGTPVGLYLNRSLEMVVALLAVMKAGGVYIPLDPAFPADRLAYMMADAGIDILLTQDALTATQPARTDTVICLDSDWQAIDQQPADPVAHQANHAAGAYVLYTSGSTGKPKGVQISHGALTNFLMAMQQTPGLTADDTLLAITTLSFDISGLELYLPLITGAKVVVADWETAVDGHHLARAIEQTGATIMQATPATWQMLLTAGWDGSPHLKILCGGEALPRQLANDLLTRSASLWNMYGPTETTIWSAVSRVEPGADPVAIGSPIANTQFHVVDKHLQPVPIGVLGQLLIGGDGLATGYLNRPKLTAEKFISDPFRAQPDARLYRTGDLVRWRADGTLSFSGRIDNQVKLRGFRIELGEIETALRQLPGIREAVVLLWENTAVDKYLVAYFIPDETAVAADATTPAALRPQLQQTLPDYMVPSFFIPLETWPLTPNGKINRRALPAPDVERRQRPIAALTPPETDTEKTIAAIWRDVLDMEKIGVNENFIELGGHSLLALQVISRARNTLQLEIPLRLIFEAPTIAEMAGVIDTLRSAAPANQPPTAELGKEGFEEGEI